jgi:predicted Rossmann fold nucleotide-binding protein DprA/Smf involved in DNA uptake
LCTAAYYNNTNLTHRTPTDSARLAAATAEADERALRERCPDCKAQLGADGPLLYCRKRCGWDLLLTAKERDPRADCDAPDDDQADDEPPPPPTVEQLLDKPRALDELVELTGLDRDDAKRELLALWDAGRAQLLDGRWSLRRRPP